MRFVIHMPDYDPCSGGVRVMHYLAALLDSVGAKVATTARCFFSPLIRLENRCGPGDIAVYPDIEPGNPLQAERVIRYLLYFASAHYARHGGVGIPKSELVFVYMQDFLADAAAHCEGPVSDADLLELPNIESAWCYSEKKTIPRLLFEGKRNCAEIPDGEFERVPSPSDLSNRWHLRHATLQLLRKSDALYTMDHYTVLEQEAMLCGCRVLRVTGKNQFAPTPWTRSQCLARRMNPVRDAKLAEWFVARAVKFFNL